jgi:hypothetical protein
MKRSHLSIVVGLLFFSSPVAAQSSQTSQTPPTPKVAGNTKPVKDPEAERLVRERQQHAQSLLITLANDAGTFNDQRLRARTLSRIADALWESEPDRARTLFRKAWDAAESADAEAQRRTAEDLREQRAKSADGGYYLVSPPEIRKEVLHLAVKHDSRLGEEFLGKLKDKEKEDRGRSPFHESESAAGHRLDLAKQLLTDGDNKAALQIATPLLSTVNRQAIEFLSSLRDRNATLADERFAVMLGLASANSQSDINTAALLASYLLTPHGYSSFGESGALPLSRRFSGVTPPDVAPALRTAFFRMAGEILMRPVQPGQDQNASDVLYKYAAIHAFIPWFQEFASPELTAGLRAQLEVLSSMVPSNQRRKEEESVREPAAPANPKPDPEQSLIDRVDRAKTSAEQDQLYYQLALLRADAGDFKARDYADKIADGELRQAVRGYVDVSMAWKAIEKRDAERALEIVRTGELPRLWKVWTMARAARLLTRTDRERALQILDDAGAEARRMDGSDADRPRAFLAITAALLAIDRIRGWDLMTDAVKVANSAPDFTGADGQLAFRINVKSFRNLHQHGMSEFNVAEVFRSLANEDLDRAVALARVFEREAPRANAVMAVALTVLEKRN